MQSVVTEYESYHFHLLYDAVLSLAGYLIVLVICRRFAIHDPAPRVKLFGLVICLPILGEAAAFVAYLARPDPQTAVGQIILRFHEECEFCSVLDEPVFLSSRPHLVLQGLFVLALISIAKSGLGRIAFSQIVAQCSPFPFDSFPEIHRHLLHVAEHCHFPLPKIVISPHMMPVAVTYGLRQPVIVVSQGMLLHYSSPELESVLIHELAHAVRRDNRWNWLIGLLRDMLALLPTSHLAWQQMIASQEEACDDFSIFWTGRPLDLARSLVKALQYPHSRELAWLSGLFLIAATFRSANAVERRIKRIIHAQRHGPQPPAGVSVSLPYAAMVFLFLLYALPIAVGC